MRFCGDGRKATTMLAVAVMAGALGCAPKAPKEQAATPEAAPPAETTPMGAPSPALFAMFEGTLPCMDCGGIKTELSLLADGTYKISETYMATKDGDKVMSSGGKWSTMTGTPTDAAATVYMLVDAGDPATMRHFVVTSESEIKILDKDLKVMASDANTSLMKKEAPTS